MAYTDSGRLGVDLSRVDTAAKHVLGTRVLDSEGGEYVYVKAGAAIAVGDAVDLGASFVSDVSATGEWVFGVSPVAIASGSFGWVKSRGVVTAKITAATAAGAQLAAEAIGAAGTLGAIADTGGGAQTLRGVALTAESGGTASVYLV